MDFTGRLFRGFFKGFSDWYDWRDDIEDRELPDQPFGDERLVITEMDQIGQADCDRCDGHPGDRILKVPKNYDRSDGNLGDKVPASYYIKDGNSRDGMLVPGRDGGSDGNLGDRMGKVPASYYMKDGSSRDRMPSVPQTSTSNEPPNHRRHPPPFIFGVPWRVGHMLTMPDRDEREIDRPFSEQPTNPHTSSFKIIDIVMVQRKDGTVSVLEETTTVGDGRGNVEKTVTRTIGDQTNSMTTRTSNPVNTGDVSKLEPKENKRLEPGSVEIRKEDQGLFDGLFGSWFKRRN